MNKHQRVLESWLPIDPAVRAQAFNTRPGGNMLFKYMNEDRQIVSVEFTHEEVQQVLARATLLGDLK